VEHGAEFLNELNRLINQKFTAARTAGTKEPRDAYAFDALIELSRTHNTETGARTGGQAEAGTGTGTGTHSTPGSGDDRTPDPTPDPRPAPTAGSSRVNPKHLALIRVDLEALLRGGVVGDELCEITGIGPIPISTARNLLGDSILKLVITNGVDVANICHLGRGVTAAQQIAILWTHPMCIVEGCNHTRTQNDHRTPWARNHGTQLGNIDPHCHHHHDLKTRLNFQLVEGTGRRPQVPPHDPRHPEHPNTTTTTPHQTTPNATQRSATDAAPAANTKKPANIKGPAATNKKSAATGSPRSSGPAATKKSAAKNPGFHQHTQPEPDQPNLFDCG